MKKRLLLRADASPTMGAGHLMRCLALALAAQAQGHEVLMAGRVVEMPWVTNKLMREKISFQLLPSVIPQIENTVELLFLLKSQKAEAVVLDGYHFGPDSQKAVRRAGFRLLVIDDYNHLPEYHADILLNQNLGAEKFDYQGEIGQKLFGPKYALLRPEFAATRKAAEQKILPEKSRQLLLTLGGGDFSSHLDILAPYFNGPELAKSTLNVLAGNMQPEKIKTALSGCSADVKVLSEVDDMPGLLLKTDLAISAGGSTCWELCCMGVPFVTVEVAENQREIIAHLKKAKIAEEFFNSAFTKCFLSGNISLPNMRALLFAVTDGLGAKMVLEQLLDAET